MAAAAPPSPAPARREYWGPSAWRVLHWMAFNAPGRLAAGGATARSWLALLADLVPCPDCSAHLRARLAATPPPARAAGLAAWTVRLHNSVNADLGKPRVPFAEARRAFAGRPLGREEALPLLHSLVATSAPGRRDALAAFVAPLGFRLAAADRRWHR